MSKVVQITVDGKSFTTDDLTLAEAEQIEKTTGESWLTMAPLRSAGHCRAIIATYLARELGTEEAQKKTDAMTVGEALDAVSLAEDDLPDEYEDGIPKVEVGPTTDS